MFIKTNWAIFTSLVQLNKQPAGYFRSNQTPGSATRRLVLCRDCRGEPWRALSPFILDENQLVLVGGWAAPVPQIYIYIWLVVWIPMKNMSSSDWIIIPTINKKMFQTTNQIYIYMDWPKGKLRRKLPCFFVKPCFIHVIRLLKWSQSHSLMIKPH